MLKNSKYDLIVFDLDGVLVDACEWHRLALNKALKEICDYEIPLEEHYNEYNGIPTKKKLQKLSEKGIVSLKDHIKINELKQEITIDIIKEQCYLRKEKIELLLWIKENGMMTACFTNSIRKTATMMLEKTGVYNLFDVVLTNEDVKKPKPDPEGYFAVLDTLNTKPTRAIIVEDSPKGLEAARKSGCSVIKVNNPDEVNIDLIKGKIQEA